MQFSAELAHHRWLALRVIHGIDDSPDLLVLGSAIDFPHGLAGGEKASGYASRTSIFSACFGVNVTVLSVIGMGFLAWVISSEAILTPKSLYSLVGRLISSIEVRPPNVWHAGGRG